ncbi:MAG: tRNA (guanosine(46)-N7)-methyltransferase TrmB [Candidatus Omnitrophica bacterium]|nr:tRNA (guanosine(46)-N7)-methyltransferase TrmB [Candidatus Omnitrophota bacterium]
MTATLAALAPHSRAKRLSPLRFQSFADFFGNDNPVEVEIGSGRGNYLSERAVRNSEINFFGVEWKSKLVELSTKRAERMNLTNIKFVATDAREVVRTIPLESVLIFHVYFPDPWFKKKHLRRRLISAGFLKMMFDRLIPGGRLEIATDNFDYQIAIRSEIAAAALPWRASHEQVNERFLDPVVKTLFEMKYTEQGRVLYYFELER